MKSKVMILYEEVENLDDDVTLIKNIKQRLDSVFNLYLNELDNASDNIESKVKFSKSSTIYKEFK